MDEFSNWLLDQGIDCQSLTHELRQALLAQFDAERPEPPAELLLIPDGADDDQWQRAVWMVPA